MGPVRSIVRLDRVRVVEREDESTGLERLSGEPPRTAPYFQQDFASKISTPLGLTLEALTGERDRRGVVVLRRAVSCPFDTEALRVVVSGNETRNVVDDLVPIPGLRLDEDPLLDAGAISDGDRG